MKSPLLALLLIVNLLACPVRCLSCQTNATAGEESAPVACACCSHCEEVPASDLPEPCGEECNCQDCICEGAVVETDIELPESDLVVEWVLPTLVDHDVSARYVDFASLRSSRSDGQRVSGRDVRIAHQSWLI
ncbi:hypothetical protein [Aporhodopirellula aestuarii]|uniref:Secreted protein n=1 Tax=Aporhodopirellula aestuarii TaxID=2950107 RepID=A0ABT0TX49_9BACT|nr:hypothetical protein [Aporhodopirellula aestuarii]MCM2369179.1 hypothetical protein [Aporhodopirellula aestuarii]